MHGLRQAFKTILEFVRQHVAPLDVSRVSRVLADSSLRHTRFYTARKACRLEYSGLAFYGLFLVMFIKWWLRLIEP